MTSPDSELAPAPPTTRRPDGLTEEDVPELAALLADFGASWTIRYDLEVMAWIAVKHPRPTAEHVLAAHNLADMRAKLRKAENAG